MINGFLQNAVQSNIIQKNKIASKKYLTSSYEFQLKGKRLNLLNQEQLYIDEDR
jgi:hypothetical protein